MKFAIVVAVAGISLPLASAFAGEGAGDPFPFHAAGVTTSTTELHGLAPDAFPFPVNANGSVETQFDTEQMVPLNGVQSTVQSANSLPPGFEDGTAAMLRHKSIEAYEAKVAQRPASGGVAQQGPATQPNQG